MLRQEQNETPALPAAQVRVTPGELSQALAAIEERKQAETSRLAGTIPIDQAISELSLDSTSEEIWAEVQAQRAKAEAGRQEQGRQEEQRQQAQAAQQQASQWQAQAARQQQFIAPPTKRRRKWTALLAPLILFWVLFHNGSVFHSRSHSTHIAASLLQPLAQVPDGKEVYVDDAALIQISEGKPQAQISVSEDTADNRWTLVKIGAHVYLRGYIANADSLQQLRGNALHIYNDSNSGELEGIKTSHITLRVDKIQLDKSGGDEDFSEITIPNFQPDSLTTVSPGH